MLPTAEKWGLTLMFALGLMTISCTVARTAIVLAAETFTYHELLAWDSGEMTLGIVVVCAPSIKWFILWVTGHKRRRAIRAFNGQADESTCLSNVDTKSTAGRESRAARGDPDLEDEEKIQAANPIAVVVKHEVSVDVESMRASREETQSASSSAKDIAGSWSDPGKSPRSFLHL
ncbi:hypothetical protein ABW19_dt0206244 [Dactylella cylindrospora]|nr:hypothetical protein ABW19_dt0206244 [Dactylella cylindrospora]